MFIVLLKFAGDKAEAGRLMAAHKDWIEQGFAAGVCLYWWVVCPAARVAR
ncbi:hypothetical protein ACRYJU_11970 [Alloalcanivorax xenomutans]